MSMFEWKEQYSVGCTQIDTQHKRLFQYADELHVAMAAGKGKEVLSKTLGNLIAYTKSHFASEEALMQRHHYGAFLQHKQVHDKLTAQVVQFQQEFETGRAGMTVQLMQFLKDWLTHHIGETDRKVAEHIRNRAA